MGGLFFRHRLIVEPFASLTIHRTATYATWLLVACGFTRSGIPDHATCSMIFSSPSLIPVSRILRHVVLERPGAIPQRGRDDFGKAGRGHGTFPLWG